jgi:hypothetical protein
MRGRNERGSTRREKKTERKNRGGKELKTKR